MTQDDGTSLPAGWEVLGVLTSTAAPKKTEEEETLEPYKLEWFSDFDLGARFDDLGNLGGFVGPAMIGWIKERTGSFEGGLYIVAGLLVLGVGQGTRLLTHLRADEIVEDCEDLRRALGLERWSLLGQSFGGFCVTRYLSEHAQSLEKVYITGGLPAVGRVGGRRPTGRPACGRPRDPGAAGHALRGLSDAGVGTCPDGHDAGDLGAGRRAGLAWPPDPAHR